MQSQLPVWTSYIAMDYDNTLTRSVLQVANTLQFRMARHAYSPTSTPAFSLSVPIDSAGRTNDSVRVRLPFAPSPPHIEIKHLGPPQTNQQARASQGCQTCQSELGPTSFGLQQQQQQQEAAQTTAARHEKRANAGHFEPRSQTSQEAEARLELLHARLAHLIPKPLVLWSTTTSVNKTSKRRRCICRQSQYVMCACVLRLDLPSLD